MIVKKTTNIDDIKAVLCNPVIYDTITDDNSESFDNIEALTSCGATVLGGYLEGKIIAVAVYHRFKDGNKYHPCVLPEYRRKFARQFVEQSLLIRGTRPLYVEIPEIYPHVIRFAKDFNFEKVDELKEGHTKNGVDCSVYVMRLKDGNS